MAKRRPMSKGTFIQQSRAAGAQAKASWHAVEGAGKGRKIRDFMQLSDADARTLTAFLQERLDQRVARGA